MCFVPPLVKVNMLYFEIFLGMREMARVLAIKNVCECMHIHTTVMNAGYVCFCVVPFLILLYSCKHKYLSTKRYKGVDRQLLIINQILGAATGTSISGVKHRSRMKPSPLPGEAAVRSPCSLFSLAFASASLSTRCNCLCCHVVRLGSRSVSNLNLPLFCGS